MKGRPSLLSKTRNYLKIFPKYYIGLLIVQICYLPVVYLAVTVTLQLEQEVIHAGRRLCAAHV